MISLSQEHKIHIVKIDELKNKKKLCVRKGDRIKFVVNSNIIYDIEDINGVDYDDPDIILLQKIEEDLFEAVQEGKVKIFFQKKNTDRKSMDDIISIIGGVIVGLFKVFDTKYYNMPIVIKEKYGVLDSLNCLF